MEIVLISDTHTRHRELTLPKGDMIIHAGDISNRGELHNVYDFLKWFSEQDAKYKVFIAGNHDFSFENEEAKCRIKECLEQYPDIIYLEDESVEIEGIKIYGSPYTPRFYNWAFNKDRGASLYKEWEKIPMDTDILVTHGPPYSYGDKTYQNNDAGCYDLLLKVKEVKPKIHLFGHIHEGYGMYSNEDTTFINAAVLDEQYHLVHDAIVIEYEHFI